jgi:hypothetical protein
LGSLISSGDLTDAQTLLTQISQHLQNGPSSSTGQSSVSSDFSALGSALSSGDTSSAQSAWKALESDLSSLSSSNATGSSSTGTSQDAWLLAAYLNSGATSGS